MNSITSRASEAIDNCQINPERLHSLFECLETYGSEWDEPHELDWPHNVLSTRTVVYDCGAYSQSDQITAHDHDPAEFSLCQRLAAAAAAIMKDQTIEMGDEGEHDLDPFYVVVNQGDPVPIAITEEVIRSAFGGTIYPQARITISPLQSGAGKWWDYLMNPDYTEPENRLTWQRLMAWYNEHLDLSNAVFVEIDLLRFEDGHENGGCVFPRLVLGLTKAGSLVGLSSCVVHT